MKLYNLLNKAIDGLSDRPKPAHARELAAVAQATRAWECCQRQAKQSPKPPKPRGPRRKPLTEPPPTNRPGE
jgi:hypothetical protein